MTKFESFVLTCCRRPVCAEPLCGKGGAGRGRQPAQVSLHHLRQNERPEGAHGKSHRVHTLPGGGFPVHLPLLLRHFHRQWWQHPIPDLAIILDGNGSGILEVKKIRVVDPDRI